MGVNKKMAAALVGAVFLLSFDRFLKTWALTCQGDPIPLVGSFLNLAPAKNPYIAFSLPIGGMAVILLTAAIILGIGFFYYRLALKRQYLLMPALTFLLLGAISNFYDRVKHGFVIDYFDLDYFTIFNLADVMIVLSVSMLLFHMHVRSK
jgi:signal peptidase II